MRSTRSVPIAVSGEGAMRRIVRRNLTAISGLALLALSAAIAASLATWTVDDPSLSHATDRDPRNALGLPGAVVADLIMQFFGLAAIALLLPPVVWAWRLVFGQTARFGWRTFAAWVGSTADRRALARHAAGSRHLAAPDRLRRRYRRPAPSHPGLLPRRDADGLCGRRPLRRLRRRRRVSRHPRLRVPGPRPARKDGRRRHRRGRGGGPRALARRPPAGSWFPSRTRTTASTMISGTSRRRRMIARAVAPFSMARSPTPRSAPSG